MNIQLIASDLDGTIIDRNNFISEKNFEAIKKINDKNISFAICTGKSYSVSKKICKQLNATYGVFGNGTQIINLQTEQELFRKTLSKEDFLFIFTIAKRYNYHIHLYTDNEIVTEKLEFLDLRNFTLNSQSINSSLKFTVIDNIEKYIDKYPNNIFSVVISTDSSTLVEFQNLLSINKNITFAYINKRGIFRDNIINKDYEYLNIFPANINKNEAIKFLSKHLNISHKNILAIGDNINDYEMVKNAEIGVAINSTFSDLKPLATYVTKATVSEGGFAEAIFKYID